MTPIYIKHTLEIDINENSSNFIEAGVKCVSILHNNICSHNYY